MNSFKKIGYIKKYDTSICSPQTADLKLIILPVNMNGKYIGSLQPKLLKRWVNLDSGLKSWYINHVNFKLGEISDSSVNSDIWVVHMLCKNDKDVLDVKSLEQCLNKVSKLALYNRGSIHVSQVLIDEMPELEGLFSKCLLENGLNIYIYKD